MMKTLLSYISEIEKQLQQLPLPQSPENLYTPIKYSLNIGGKRVRPALLLMAAELFGADIQTAIPAALCVEVFHNFTLIHDDIMDKAPLRRGKPTVPEKWDNNIAILSGDAMMILAYQQLLTYETDTLHTLLSVFNKTALEVCEGQQMDMDFEAKNDVNIDDYLKMITLKTSVLLAASLQMGAIIGKADTNNQTAIYEFGKHLGIAFQLKDDWLDTFGNSDFGKQIGGDIQSGKKTFLYLSALQRANSEQKQFLFNQYQQKEKDVNAVINLFKELKVDALCEKEITRHFNKSLQYLQQISYPHPNIDKLKQLSEELILRNV